MVRFFLVGICVLYMAAARQGQPDHSATRGPAATIATDP
jgi:hypothetical protein